ncbi:MAG: rRNA maturation RNase YbeY [candidate division WOR-3 bacterium]|jgi:probable rRNA maturation factor
MSISVNNIPEFKIEILKTARKVVKSENLSGDLSITFIDDKEMKRLNRKYTNRGNATDVLSFHFDDIPELMGDIYISLQQAKRQKEKDLLSELKLLTIHGILHLAGYNDKTEEETKVMREKERYYLGE